MALAFTTLSYGLFYVAMKIVVGEITPMQTFGLRLLLAVPLFVLVERTFFKTPIHSVHDGLKILGLGLLGISLVQGTIVLGIKYTSIFHAGVIIGSAPIAALILSVLVGQETFSLMKLIGTLVAFTGLILLLSNQHTQASLPPTYLWGDAIIFFNILAWSFYLILSRPLLKTYPAFSLTTYSFLLASLATLPVYLFFNTQLPWEGLSATGWGWMGFIVIFATLLTYFLNTYALKLLPASTVSLYVQLQPIATIAFSHWILQETVTLGMILNGFIICLGVTLATGAYRPIKQLFFKSPA